METPYLQVVAWYISPVASLAWWVPLLWGLEKVALDRLAALSLTTCLWPYLGKVSKLVNCRWGTEKVSSVILLSAICLFARLRCLGPCFFGLVGLASTLDLSVLSTMAPQQKQCSQLAHSWHAEHRITQSTTVPARNQIIQIWLPVLCEYSRGQLDMRSKFSLWCQEHVRVM